MLRPQPACDWPLSVQGTRLQGQRHEPLDSLPQGLPSSAAGGAGGRVALLRLTGQLCLLGCPTAHVSVAVLLPHSAMDASTAAVEPQQVLQVLQAVTNGDLQSQHALRAWEQDAQPGFFRSLVAVIDQPQTIAEARAVQQSSEFPSACDGALDCSQSAAPSVTTL